MQKLHRKTKVVGGKRLALSLYVIVMMMICSMVPVFAADANYGQNIGQWVMEQAFWIALCAVAVASIGFIMKRAWMAFLIFAVLSGLALTLIKNPQLLETMGGSLLQVVVGN